jgi:hypothetical protein
MRIEASPHPLSQAVTSQRGSHRRKGPAFSGLPWDAVIAQNQILNRVIVEFLGYTPWSVALSRNNYERAEKLMDSVSWLIIGITMPIVLGKGVNRWLTGRFLKRYPQAFLKTVSAKKPPTPLGLPFEWLDTAGFTKRFRPGSAMQKRLADHGLKALPKALANDVLYGKLFGIMMIDYMALAAKANLYNFGRNWLTEKLSGKKGFSAELTIASDQYREAQAAAYADSAKKRKRLSITLSVLGSAAFPFILLGLLKSRTPANRKTLIGQVKKRIRWFNYSNIVYLSKYALMWQVFWNWNLSGFLAARDKHERREHLVKSVVGDFFFFIGDDFISGSVAKALQKKHRKALRGIRLLEPERGLFGNLQAKDLGKIYDTASTLKNAQQKQLLIRCGRQVFATGLLGTALCMGIAMTLVNNWYTRKKISSEDLGAKTPA